MTHQPFINLVATRCTDGQHLALQRWYADHVHLLLTTTQLQQAQLFRCTHTLAGHAPEYVCIYDFAHQEDFFSYEASSEKAKASELTNLAAGRSSVEIVQRKQYTRWLHRQWHAPTPVHKSVQGESWRLAACIQSASAWDLDAQRWLADQLQALHSSAGLLAAQAFVQHDEPMQALLALDVSPCDAHALWQHVESLLAQTSLYGAKQTLHIHWATRATFIQAWLR